MNSAKAVIEHLQLQRHPEGGWYRETFRDLTSTDQRATSTAIFYMLEAGDKSHWHKVDAAEIWHFYLGAPLQLSISADGHRVEQHILGTDFTIDQSPQIIVPRNHWQSAKSSGDWTLVGCSVAPGFEFSGFTLAPADWTPG